MLVCLDLDGTLEDSRDDMVAAVGRVRTAFDVPARPAGDLRRHVNRGMDHLYRTCFDDVLVRGAVTVDSIRSAYEADYLAHVADHTRLYPGVGEVLPALAELGALAVVTNKPERICRALLIALGIDAYFGCVIGGDTLGVIKPSPELIRAAVARLGLDPETSVVMVGDSAGDIRMGRAYGAGTVWCGWGYADTPGDHAPDAIAERPECLPARVGGLAPK